jgi:hypothetical protein
MSKSKAGPITGWLKTHFELGNTRECEGFGRIDRTW